MQCPDGYVILCSLLITIAAVFLISQDVDAAKVTVPSRRATTRRPAIATSRPNDPVGDGDFRLVQMEMPGPDISDEPVRYSNKYTSTSRPGRPGRTQRPDGNSVPSQKPGTVSLTSKIVGGTLAKRGQFSYQVCVIQDAMYLCGGSLITPSHALTAGHCCFQRQKFRLILGMQNLSVFEEGRVTFETTDKIVHPKYVPTTLSNDCCILLFPAAVSVPTPYINVVKLPRWSQQKQSFANALGYVTGYGKTADAGSVTSSLKVATLIVMSNAECVSSFKAGIIVDSTLCSYTGKNSTCQGDSGGALVIEEQNNVYLQIGINSFVSSSGCESGKPAGFARITSYLDWISNTTNLVILP